MAAHHSVMRASHPNAGIAAGSFIKTKGDAVVRSFDEAVKFLAGERVKLLASNVLVVVNEGEPCCPEVIAIRLYDTDILLYYKPSPTVEEFSADNGGFRTPTTVTRLNQFGPRGYHFCHSNKVLMCGGAPASHKCRFPVWNHESLIGLARNKGLEPADFAQAGLVDEGQFETTSDLIERLLHLGFTRKCLAERIKAMPVPEGKTPYILVSTYGDKPICAEPSIVNMNADELAKSNEWHKAFRQHWIPYLGK